MLPSILFALLAFICQTIVLVTAAALPREHRHKLRHQYGGRRNNQRHEGKYNALEQLLRAALKVDQEDFSDDLIQDAMKQSFSRRNRSLDNGVLEQQTCQHEDLISCEDYSTEEKECHVTATGMSCCRCKGRLLQRRRRRTPLSSTK